MVQSVSLGLSNPTNMAYLATSKNDVTGQSAADS